MLRIARYSVCLLVVLLTASCFDKQPEGIMGEGQMEDVLYDYHLAQAVASQSSDSTSFRMHEYTEAVLKKHNVTQADFDSSLVWYSQHTEILYKIYGDINERLNREARSLGAATSQTNLYSSLSNKGDTANIWNGQMSYLLSNQDISNRMSFSINADSSFHPQDKFLWHFNAKFVYSEGSRDAIACLAVQYENDSVSSVIQHLFSDDEQTITLTTTKAKIKRVFGFVYLNAPWTKDERLMLMMAPSLVRFHYREVATPTSTPTGANEPVKMKSDSIRVIHKDSGVHARPLPRMRSSFLRPGLSK